MDPCVFKPKTPPGVVISAVLIAVGVAAFIIFATWQSTIGVVDSKKTGKVIEKEVQPLAEKQIIVDRKGNLTTEFKDGEYILTVEVPQREGGSKKYYVFLPDKPSYDAVKIGDSYDVGPYLVPEKK